MKLGPGWLIAAAVLLFVGFLMYASMPRVRNRCEVCLEFNGELVCRKGAGATEEEARRAAQESACGGNARGMSESIRCRNATPVRAQCTAT
ncbi:MAG TPA: hypothetical protein VGR37_01640 [Longimicrobiaceae bacterium]|nr:hypothetical protein [Longimicrobiaceae bacterium]